ncbi:Ferredoxin-1 [Actinosynnema sp. ALI-1.44]
MRIEVDPERCAGSGMCALTDPAVFDQSEDDGTVVLLAAEPIGHEREAREAAHLCPAGAIKVIE